MKFKVGDRVRAKEDLVFAKKGMFGTIKFVDVDDNGHVNKYLIAWDDTVDGLNKAEFGITNLNVEWIVGDEVEFVESNSYELHIICKDGIATNCVYKKNGKIVSRSSTRRNVKYDDFDFAVAVDNCTDRVFKNIEETKNDIIGKRVQIKSLTKAQRGGHLFVCTDSYIGQCGIAEKELKVFNWNTHELDIAVTIKFDEPYMQAIDDHNGHFLFTKEQLEVFE